MLENISFKKVLSLTFLLMGVYFIGNHEGRAGKINKESDPKRISTPFKKTQEDTEGKSRKISLGVKYTFFSPPLSLDIGYQYIPYRRPGFKKDPRDPSD